MIKRKIVVLQVYGSSSKRVKTTLCVNIAPDHEKSAYTHACIPLHANATPAPSRQKVLAGSSHNPHAYFDETHEIAEFTKYFQASAPFFVDKPKAFNGLRPILWSRKKNAIQAYLRWFLSRHDQITTLFIPTAVLYLLVEGVKWLLKT